MLHSNGSLTACRTHCRLNYDNVTVTESSVTTALYGIRLRAMFRNRLTYHTYLLT